MKHLFILLFIWGTFLITTSIISVVDFKKRNQAEIEYAKIFVEHHIEHLEDINNFNHHTVFNGQENNKSIDISQKIKVIGGTTHSHDAFPDYPVKIAFTKNNQEILIHLKQDSLSHFILTNALPQFIAFIAALAVTFLIMRRGTRKVRALFEDIRNISNEGDCEFQKRKIEKFTASFFYDKSRRNDINEIMFEFARELHKQKALTAQLEDTLSQNATKQKQVEKAESRLEESRKWMQEIIHELYTPIITAKQLSEKSLRLSAHDNTWHDIKVINNAMEYSSTLIEVFAYRQLRNNKSQIRTPINIRVVIEDALAISQQASTFTGQYPIIDINVQSNTEIPCILFTDETAIKDVLINIFKNSLKYSNCVKNAFYIEIEYYNNEAYVTVSHKDEGMGYPLHILNDCTSHYENDYDRTSFGLGLTIIKERLKSINSELQINNRMKDTAGSISSFSFICPAELPFKSELDGHCIGLYANEQHLIDYTVNISKELGCQIELLQSTIEPNNATIIIVEYNPEIAIDTLRHAASFNPHSVLLVVCNNQNFAEALALGITSEFEDEEEQYNNIFIVKQYARLTDIIDALKFKERKASTETKKRILLIEDNQREIDAITRCMGEATELVAVKEPEHALQILKAKKFDAIICDFSFENSITISSYIEELSEIWGACTNKILRTGYGVGSPNSEHVEMYFDHTMMKSANLDELVLILKKSGINAKPGVNNIRQLMKKEMELDYIKKVEDLRGFAQSNDLRNYRATLHHIVNILRSLGFSDAERLQAITDDNADINIINSRFHTLIEEHHREIAKIFL